MNTVGQKRLALVVGAIALAAIAALGWPEVRYQSALRKYRFGVTAEALERETGAHIELQKTGNYLVGDEDDLNKRRHPCYYARPRSDYVELVFNDFHELIGIKKRTPLARRGFFPERKLHSMFTQPVQ